LSGNYCHAIINAQEIIILNCCQVVVESIIILNIRR
jgi:hypothetical protein